MLVVLMMAFLLTLQWSLAASVLCAAWRRAEGARSRLAVRALACVPLLTLMAAGTLLAADEILVWTERLLMLLLAGLTGGLWLFGYARVEDAPGDVRPLYRSPNWIGLCWVGLSALLQGAFLLTATWIAVSDFLIKSPQMTEAWRWLWLTLVGASAGGALLLAVAWAGVVISLVGAPEPSGRPAALPRLSLVLLGLVLLRAALVAGSLVLWFDNCPFGGGYFISRLVSNGFHIVLLRLLLGLVLPLLFGLLALQAWYGEGRPQFAFQYLPTLILVLISEMLAASLTVGLGGIAF